MRDLNINDPHFQLKLTTALVPLNLVDDAGRVVGQYTPRVTVDDLKASGDWATDEELEAARNRPGPRYTTEQVIAHLRSLG